MPPVVAAFGALAAGAAMTVTQVVIVGAVTGAVVGGVTAAIKGENILMGALKGGVIGGLTAYVGAVATGAPSAIGGTALPSAEQSAAYTSATSSGINGEAANSILTSGDNGVASLNAATDQFTADRLASQSMIEGQAANGGSVVGDQIASNVANNSALGGVPTTQTGIMAWAEANPQLAGELGKGAFQVAGALLEPSEEEKARAQAQAIKDASMRNYVSPTVRSGGVSVIPTGMVNYNNVVRAR